MSLLNWTSSNSTKIENVDATLELRNGSHELSFKLIWYKHASYLKDLMKPNNLVSPTTRILQLYRGIPGRVQKLDKVERLTASRTRKAFFGSLGDRRRSHFIAEYKTLSRAMNHLIIVEWRKGGEDSLLKENMSHITSMSSR